MNRFDPRLPMLVAGALIAAEAVVLATMVIPAYGQECRFAHQCEFVPVAHASKPAEHSYRVRRHFTRPHRHHVVAATKMIQRDTLTAADRKLAPVKVAEPEMPLVWPVLDEAETVLAAAWKDTRGAMAQPPLSPSVSREKAGVEPGPRETSWRHTETGKRAILAAFALFVAATAAAIILTIGEKHERANTPRRPLNRQPNYARFFRRNGPAAWRTRAPAVSQRAA
jgi:hypothetical protein